MEQAKKEKENNSRPEIIGEIKNLKEYNYVFIGYPNWWGTMPMPIYTFLENNNFEGITLIPFCTHGGGGVQQCFKDFTANTTQYTTKEGFLANGSSVHRAKPHVEKWLKEKVGSIYRLIYNKDILSLTCKS